MDRQHKFLKVKTKIADMYILNPTEYVPEYQLYRVVHVVVDWIVLTYKLRVEPILWCNS